MTRDPHPPDPRPASLPALPGRGRTYAFMAGVVATTLTLALVLPLAFGHRPTSGAPTTDALALGGPAASAGPGAAAPGPGTGTPASPGTGGLASGGSGSAGTGSGSAGTGSGTNGTGGSSGTGGTGGSGNPSVSGSGRAGSGSGDSRAGGTGQPGAVAGSDAGGSSTAGATRRASDQGVTPTSVRVGVFLIDFGPANGLGAGVSHYDPPMQRQVAQTYVDQVNQAGGVAGRRLVPLYRTVDILDQQTMRDACTSFGQTDRVFAVAQVLGVYGDPILRCAQEQHLPFLSNDGAASSYYTASNHAVITTQPSTLRTILNLEGELVRRGELRGKKVGVLYYDGYLLADNQRLLAQLRRDGIDPVEGRLSASDVGLALSQLPSIARNFCARGVQVAVLLTNELYARQFVQNVDQSPGCAPTYVVSDFDFAMNGNSFVRDMPASFFRRALAVTASRNGEAAPGAEAPIDARCRSVYERRNGVRLDRAMRQDDTYFNALAMCGVVSVLAQGLQGAGVNPTRAGFVQAVQELGPFANPYYGPSSFRPGRTDSTDAVRITQAFLSCRCWKPQTPFAAATYR